MSDLLSFSGKLLAPVGKIAAKRLASRLGYDRWRIARSVRNTTKLSFPEKQYRKWLKSLTLEDFDEPVETAAARMAVSLDEALSAAGSEWTTKSGRTSASLRLVEGTYAALLALLDHQATAGLADHWAQNRSDVILTQLSELTLTRGGWGKLDGADLAIYLKRRSWERRAIRLEAVGIGSDKRAAIIALLQPEVPEVPAGAVRVLVGPFGSGKTEVAEAWHLSQVVALEAGEDAPIPIWLYARDLVNETVERAVQNAMGSDELLRTRGAAVVVDGVDEVEGAAAEAIARDSRVLVAGSPRSRVLLTSRPHVLPSTADDLAPQELNQEVMAQLVEVLGGRPVAAYSWPAALRESAKRPFFALGAASASVAGSSISGPAGLIRHLVELAMSRGTSQTLVQANDLFEALVELAVTFTGHATVNVDYATRQRLLGTRLLTMNSSGSLQFSLPIFEQWFAAQRILKDDSSLRQAFANRSSYDRWRWAAAIALSGADGLHADALMREVLRLNPGAAGWLLKQVGANFSFERDQPDTDFQTVGSRKVSAMRSWVDAIGPLTDLCFPMSHAGAGMRLGLRVSENGWQEWAWSTEPSEVDDFVPLPDDVRTLFGPPVAGWTRGHGGYPPAGTAWPYESVRRSIAGSTLKILEDERLLGGTSGVWADELMYRYCRTLSGSRTILHPAMSRADLKAKVAELSSLADDPGSTRFVFGTRSIFGGDLPLLADWLETSQSDCVTRPVPAPDLQLSPSSGFVWDVYSDVQLVKLAAEIYGNSCQAYDEVASTTFRCFDWSLGRVGYGPFGILGAITRGTAGRWGDGPSIKYIQLPVEILEEVSSDAAYVQSSNGRAAIRWCSKDEYSQFDIYEMRPSLLQSWAEKSKKDTGPFGSLSSASSIFDTAHDRAASEIAAGWLFDDLKNISLGEGTFPQLNR